MTSFSIFLHYVEREDCADLSVVQRGTAGIGQLMLFLSICNLAERLFDFLW